MEEGENRTDTPARSRRAGIVVVSLVVAAGLVGWLRLRSTDYRIDFLVPVETFNLALVMKLEGYGSPVDIRTYLPVEEDRQQILGERAETGGFLLRIGHEDGNRTAHFHSDFPKGEKTIEYDMQLAIKGVRYEISPRYRVERPSGGVPERYTRPTETIQSTAEEIDRLARNLLPDSGRLVDYLRAVFDRVRSLQARPFKGTTDALTALRLGEASCNGRSRLMVALLRNRGIPARLVGGIILTGGTKRITHQWVEVWIDGHWVPMDPTNGHFASLPHNYLVLYRGDLPLFRRTADVAFDYRYRIERRLVPRQQIDPESRQVGFWSAFAEVGIPLELLKVLIMIPLGALVVLMFRNVIGTHTFGTFLPALIAAAARGTGILWGLVGFVLLIAILSMLRRLLERLQLLHSPQLTVLLTAVIASMLLLATAGIKLGVARFPKISLFPVAILAITAERFTLMEIEQGRIAAWLVMAQTLLVVFFCYVVMNSLVLQVLMLAFPEMLLVVAALAVWLGSWTGLRLSEWIRFGPLIWKKAG
ncbi:MAG: transglutaminase [Deltaproteobacteria bacterium]|nr:MAG: transglutaminase [Deltaproteobacteria bacterium]